MLKKRSRPEGGHSNSRKGGNTAQNLNLGGGGERINRSYSVLSGKCPRGKKKGEKKEEADSSVMGKKRSLFFVIGGKGGGTLNRRVGPKDS